ncbi:VWA domain-containing protein [Nocardioides zeae]|uniref:VWA domain-containing protein n=1 Tax=Nocardioides imazamoxiresistens TaxID=3231893 RepID=A0ABU3PYV1_9ACTN|nr:VWA domain-containing protein [Nocardioides zeae]MDT9594399.1 VWA domain-containing protein [Nocardioides zeae]
MTDRLGGAVGRRPLHLVLVLDLSGSMRRGGRIQALNTALREVLPRLRDEARANPHTRLLVRVLGFATQPWWVLATPTPVEELTWQPLEAVPQGLTELGSALVLLADAMADLDAEAASGHGAYPPAIVLVSDGRPTATTGTDVATGMARLLATRAGAGAVRLALGVGRDADLPSLRRFIGDDEVPVLRADNPEQLVECMAWASRAASRGASMPALTSTGISVLPPELTGEDVWGSA